MRKLTAQKIEAKVVVTRKPKTQPKRKPATKRDACFDATNYLLEEHPELY
jgi:hypothetical protein